MTGAAGAPGDGRRVGRLRARGRHSGERRRDPVAARRARASSPTPLESERLARSVDSSTGAASRSCRVRRPRLAALGGNACHAARHELSHAVPGGIDARQEETTRCASLVGARLLGDATRSGTFQVADGERSAGNRAASTVALWASPERCCFLPKYGVVSCGGQGSRAAVSEARTASWQFQADFSAARSKWTRSPRHRERGTRSRRGEHLWRWCRARLGAERHGTSAVSRHQQLPEGVSAARLRLGIPGAEHALPERNASAAYDASTCRTGRARPRGERHAAATCLPRDTMGAADLVHSYFCPCVQPLLVRPVLRSEPR